ncbi:hypothetical protein MYX77_02135 [Acidobacteriia bacterium AH_259_A11_L15]|nr:hypothetical protein [Acidobacteriia bacterium AH_259_A11_L15]
MTESIRVLLREEGLLRVRRGLYVDRVHGYRPEIVGQRWLAPSYLSTETALSRHQLCDTGIAAYTYVTTRLLPRRGAGRKTFDGHQFIYRHVARHLFFGHRVDDGAWLAEPEKAVLDFLYFVYKKQRSVLSPEDIDFSPLNPSRYRQFLGAFRQRGFDEFALRWWKERRGRR